MADVPGDATLARLFQRWLFWSRNAQADAKWRVRADLAWELYVGELLSCEVPR